MRIIYFEMHTFSSENTVHELYNLHLNIHFFLPFKVDKQNQQVDTPDWLSAYIHDTSH